MSDNYEQDDRLDELAEANDALTEGVIGHAFDEADDETQDEHGETIFNDEGGLTGTGQSAFFDASDEEDIHPRRAIEQATAAARGKAVVTKSDVEQIKALILEREVDLIGRYGQERVKRWLEGRSIADI